MIAPRARISGPGVVVGVAGPGAGAATSPVLRLPSISVRPLAARPTSSADGARETTGKTLTAAPRRPCGGARQAHVPWTQMKPQALRPLLGLLAVIAALAALG